jgi:hypothetical protein
MCAFLEQLEAISPGLANIGKRLRAVAKLIAT